MPALPEYDEGHSGERVPIHVIDGDPAMLPRRIDSFLHDALTEVFIAAERQWWIKRSEDFLDARPKVGEFHGRSTRVELNAQWRRLTAMADACRARAEVSPVRHIREDVLNALSEVA